MRMFKTALSFPLAWAERGRPLDIRSTEALLACSERPDGARERYSADTANKEGMQP
jgi:hypothetical protein